MIQDKQKNSKIPNSIWAIGFSSMLLNISTAMVFGIAALYLKEFLGIATGFIVLLEGFFEAFAYLTKLFSGIVSDYLKKRKTIILIGFSMITIARPILGLFESLSGVLTARILDRLGNGIQSTPRDALVSDLAPKELKGSCFGLRQSLAVFGSFAGGAIGFIVMYYFNKDFKSVFLVAGIPALLGFLILLVFVKDKNNNSKAEHNNSDKKNSHQPIKLSDLKKLGQSYWLLMLVNIVFMSSRIGESVLIIHATQNFGIEDKFAHLIMILYNVTNSIFSYPIGALSDKFGRFKFLALSIFVLILANLFLSLSPTLNIMLIGVGLWGVQIGMSQSMFLSIIADKTPSNLRGTAIGFYYLVSSTGLVLAGFIASSMSKLFNDFAIFVTSGSIALFSLLLLFLFKNKLADKT